MFEEVPRPNRGPLWLSARRVVLGPFVIGGGLALALLGGSVAVAATVITASTVGLHDLAPHPHPSLPVAAGPAPLSTSSRPVAPRSSPTSHPVSSRPDPSSAAVAAPPTSVAAPAPSPSSAATGTSRPSTPGTSSAAASPSPAGNALIYVAGYDRSGVLFGYATDAGATGGVHRYAVSSAARYHAELAQGATITSGGTICPPAGTVCTAGQLIAAADTGFYAEVAIDSDGRLAAVTERDSGHAFGPRPTPSTSAPAPVTSSPKPLAPPTATSSPTSTRAAASCSPVGGPTAAATSASRSPGVAPAATATGAATP